MSAHPVVPGGLTGNALPSRAIPNFTPPPNGGAYYPSFCYLSPADIQYASGGGTPSSASNKFNVFLPSFNVRIDLSPKWLVRFAASKAISRPDIGFLKNYLAIGMNLPNGSDLTDSRWVIGPDGQPTGVNPFYSANAFNPYLKPSEAWQYDLSVENYFANVGQFSVAAFYKKFTNYIQYGTFAENIVNNGVTRTVLVTGPANGNGAKITGFEVDYQRFFDFLPGLWSGLGVQANFTYVKNKGVPNANLTPVGDRAPSPTPATHGHRSSLARSRACPSTPTTSSACTRRAGCRRASPTTGGRNTWSPRSTAASICRCGRRGRAISTLRSGTG